MVGDEGIGHRTCTSSAVPDPTPATATRDTPSEDETSRSSRQLRGNERNQRAGEVVGPFNRAQASRALDPLHCRAGNLMRHPLTRPLRIPSILGTTEDERRDRDLTEAAADVRGVEPTASAPRRSPWYAKALCDYARFERLPRAVWASGRRSPGRRTSGPRGRRDPSTGSRDRSPGASFVIGCEERRARAHTLWAGWALDGRSRGIASAHGASTYRPRFSVAFFVR